MQSSIHLYCTGDTSCRPGNHSVCAVRTVYRIDQKSLSIRKKPMHAEWFSHSKCLELLPHVAVKRFWGGIRKIDYKYIYLHAASTRLLLAARRQQFGLSCNVGCCSQWSCTYCVPFWQLHKIPRITLLYGMTFAKYSYPIIHFSTLHQVSSDQLLSWSLVTAPIHSHTLRLLTPLPPPPCTKKPAASCQLSVPLE